MPCCRSPECRRLWPLGLFGTSALPVEVTLACSGADALALCLGAVLAYPVKWRTRLAGAGGGAALILGLNTLRIGTLGRVAASPAWFNTLHVYVWPAVLTLAIAGYVFGWMRLADRRHALAEKAVAAREPFLRGARNRRDDSSCSRWHFCSCFRRPRRSISRVPASSRWPASSPARLQRSSASSASARTRRPTCSGRRAGASSSRRNAFRRR